MWALKEIDRSTGKEQIVKIIENKMEAWNEMITLNGEKCDDFNGRGYGYGKEQGMRGMMYYVDGQPGTVYDITNLDYTDFVMDYTKENNIK